VSLDSATPVAFLGISAQQRLMAGATIRDLLGLTDTRCRSIGIVHAGEFTLLTIAGRRRTPNSSFAVRKEPVNQKKFLVITLMLVAFAATNSALA
jgi:hypothetical protein